MFTALFPFFFLSLLETYLIWKELATLLQAMVGVWYLGQADCQAPAAQAAAVAAWQSAFPTPEKQSRALAFCREEILSLIIENVTVATAQTLSDPKAATPEEMEAKYVRTLSTSLLAYSALLDSAAGGAASHGPLLDSPKFWKLARHSSTSVRQAFYTVISKLCSVLPDTIVSRGKAVVPAVLGGLQDAEAAASVWGAALHLLNVFPAAWDHISHQKAVFPTIWKLLKLAGGGGGEGHSAAQVYPNLMPFLSKIPASVIGDSGKFLQRWFSSMMEGLQLEKVQKNAPECRAVTQSMVECLFYCLNNKELESEVKDSLVSEHLLELVKFCLTEGREKNCRLLRVLPDYLLFWDRQCSSSPQVAHLNGLFWAGLRYYCSSCEGTGSNRLQLAGAMIDLAKVLESKCFKEKPDLVAQDKAAHLGEMLDILAMFAVQAVADLEKSGQESSSSSGIHNIQESVTILESILNNFSHHAVILSKLRSEPEPDSSSARLSLYRSVIAPLVSRPSGDPLCNEESLSRLTWALAKQADLPEAVAIIEEFVSATRPLVVNYIIPLAVSEATGRGKEFLATWLARDFVLSLLTGVAEDLALSIEAAAGRTAAAGGSGSDSNWSILRTILGCGVDIPQAGVSEYAYIPCILYTTGTGISLETRSYRPHFSSCIVPGTVYPVTSQLFQQIDEQKDQISVYCG
jgi:hypothetical protein